MSKQRPQRGENQSLTDYKLDRCLDSLEGIESCLFGDDAGRDGIKLDVDRLKRSRSTHNAVLWVLFTTLLGVGGTVLAGVFIK